jgi:hypothetical protein
MVTAEFLNILTSVMSDLHYDCDVFDILDDYDVLGWTVGLFTFVMFLMNMKFVMTFMSITLLNSPTGLHLFSKSFLEPEFEELLPDWVKNSVSIRIHKDGRVLHIQQSTSSIIAEWRI